MAESTMLKRFNFESASTIVELTANKNYQPVKNFTPSNLNTFVPYAPKNKMIANMVNLSFVVAILIVSFVIFVH